MGVVLQGRKKMSNSDGKPKPEDVQWLLARRLTLMSEGSELSARLNDVHFELHRVEEALKSCGAYPNQKG
jgi:hypothetical protein